MLRTLLYFLTAYYISLTFGQECGISYQTPNARIVGGITALPNSWPSLALIKFSYKRDISINGRIFTYTFAASCGGTLISKSVILICFFHVLILTFPALFLLVLQSGSCPLQLAVV